MQRAVDDRDPRWLALTAVAAAAAGWVLLVARSKTSIVTPIIGVAGLAVWWAFGDALRRHARTALAAGVAAVVVVGLGVVGLGLARGELFAGHFSNSLDFRWKYWTAAAGVWRDHPVLGVGWANFGGSYLAHRRPEAAEEIQDPHNFLVRFAAELGAVGLGLAVAWLVRTAWELTRPGGADEGATDRPVRVDVVAWAACLGVGLSIAATIDLTGNPLDALVLAMRPVLLLAAVVLGGIVGCMRSADDRRADGRPGPWVYATAVVGLGLFLLHNLIDFAWFEPGAMFAFMTLIGATLGMARADERPVPGGRAWAAGGLAVGTLAWVAVALGVALPIGLATAAAGAADDVVRAAPAERPGEDAGAARRRAGEDAAAYRRAADGYAAAAALVPYDAELLSRAARAAALGGDGPRAEQLVAAAERADPRLLQARLLDAELRLAAKDLAGTRAAFDAAVRLNPNDVPIRLRYAQALDALGDPRAAAAEYRAGLAADAALPAGEPRRLSAGDVARYRTRADR